MTSSEVHKALMEYASVGYHSQQPARMIREFMSALKGILDPEQLGKARRLLIELAGTAPEGVPTYVLSISHLCAAPSCSLEHCQLCRHAALRPCVTDLAAYYVQGVPLATRCGGKLRIMVYRTGQAEALSLSDLQNELAGVTVEMRVVTDAEYQRASTSSRAGDLDWAALLNDMLLDTRAGRGNAPVLAASGAGATVTPSGIVRFSPRRAAVDTAPGVEMPDVSFTVSGEALLGGKRPKLRLAARIVRVLELDDESGPEGDVVVMENVRGAVSNAFCVATKRTQHDAKSEVPGLDEHVKVIEHMGDKCIEKLRNFEATAARHSLVVPEGCESVVTVAQLRDAARVNDNLGDALGIKAKEKWGEVLAHLGKAVEADARLRVFYSGPVAEAVAFSEARRLTGSVDVGLVFRASRGLLQMASMKDIVGVVLRSVDRQTEMLAADGYNAKATDVVHRVYTLAASCWRQIGHPGWALYHYKYTTATKLVAEPGEAYETDRARVPPADPPALSAGIDPWPQGQSLPLETEALDAPPRRDRSLPDPPLPDTDADLGTFSSIFDAAQMPHGASGSWMPSAALQQTLFGPAQGGDGGTLKRPTRDVADPGSMQLPDSRGAAARPRPSEPESALLFATTAQPSAQLSVDIAAFLAEPSPEARSSRLELDTSSKLAAEPMTSMFRTQGASVQGSMQAMALQSSAADAKLLDEAQRQVQPSDFSMDIFNA